MFFMEEAAMEHDDVCRVSFRKSCPDAGVPQASFLNQAFLCYGVAPLQTAPGLGVRMKVAIGKIRTQTTETVWGYATISS